MIRPLRRLLALSLIAALAGCAAALPTVDPDPAPPAPLPVLSEEQLERVLTAVGDVVREADAASDGEALAARVGGPALAMRRAQYTLRERSDGGFVPTPLTTEDQVAVVAATDGWPRVVMAITAVPEGGNVPLLVVLQQEDARSAYTLRGWVRLFPGVTTPQLAGPAAGSPQVPADAEGLVASPSQTVARYADVVVNGSGSEFAGAFVSDAYQREVTDALASVRSALEGIGNVTYTAAPADGLLAALGTVDGGALVVGVLSSTTGYEKTLAGSTVTLAGEFAEWLDGGEVPNKASVTHLTTVAFYVPVAAEGAQITAIGADRVLVDATRE